MHHTPIRPRIPSSAHRRLHRLLAARIAPGLMIVESSARDWASASFIGERHFFRCAAINGDCAALASALRPLLVDADWSLPGHIVADVTLEQDGEGEGHMLRIEILTVAD